MKISTKGRYALRFMLDLAMYDTGTPVRIKDISTRQGISVKYLEQIVSILNKAGFVRAIRGPQGGYQLVKPPEEYTALMIFLRSTLMVSGKRSPCGILSLSQWLPIRFRYFRMSAQ